MFPALPLSPTERRLKNGRLACHAHSLPNCSICGLDFTQLNYDDDDYDFGGRREYTCFRNGYDDDEPEGWEKEETWPLQGSAASFMSLCDAQLLDSVDQSSLENYDHSRLLRSGSLSNLDLQTCPICQLSWFVGRMGPAAASSHPSHHTYYDSVIGTERSLVVYTDGFCRQRTGNDSIIGVGVFFQDNSKFNISEPFVMEPDVIATNQIVGLYAIICALQVVRLRILRERIEHIDDAGHGRSEEAKYNFLVFRLVIVTDLAYAITAMLRGLPKWTWDAQRQLYERKRGAVVKKSRGFRRIADEVDALARVGIQVVYYRPHRNEASQADRLAYEGFSKGLQREKGSIKVRTVDNMSLDMGGPATS